MGKVVYSRIAANKLRDIYKYYLEFDAEIAGRAVQSIAVSLSKLSARPRIGRPVIDRPDYREWIVPFGEQGFITLYRIEGKNNDIVVVGIRHQREAGYEMEIE